MGQYLFSCCGRTVTIADTNAVTGSFAHLCLNDAPCFGVATLVGYNLPASDVTTEAIDPVTGAADGADGGAPNNGDGQ